MIGFEGKIFVCWIGVSFDGVEFGLIEVSFVVVQIFVFFVGWLYRLMYLNLHQYKYRLLSLKDLNLLVECLYHLVLLNLD